MLIIGCNEQFSTQSNPPPNDQDLTAGTKTTISEKAKQPAQNRYIVIFKEQPSGIASSQAAQMAVEKTNTIFSTLNIPQDSLIHQYKWSSQGFAGRFTNEQVEELRKHPLVDHVAKDYYYKAIQVSSFNSTIIDESMGPLQTTQTTPWGVDRVGGPLDGTGRTAWILDTGIDLDHPDLNVDVGRSASFVATEPADDGLGHGTYVSGLLAARNNASNIVGVAAGASVVAVRVCDDQGGCWTSDVEAGVDYATGNFTSGDVVNISLGWPTDGSNPNVDISLSALENAITNAANSGLKFAISAGNDNDDSNNYSPARLETNNVWTISAFDNTDTFSSFSNYGNPPIEYGAPGEDIRSLRIGGGYGMGFAGPGSEDGTSYSAPILAGLLLAADYGIDTDGTVSGDPDGDPDKIAVAAQDEPLSVQVGGPHGVNDDQTATFSASVSNAEGSVNYQWYYRQESYSSWIADGSNSSSYSHTFHSAPGGETAHSAVKVEITSAGETASDIHSVDVYGSGDCQTEPQTNSADTNIIIPCD